MSLNIKFYVINMDRDKERLETFTTQMSQQNLTFERHIGPVIDETEVSFGGNSYRVSAKGYVGVALAHLRLWEKIAQLEDDTLLCNVFEDDEVLKDNYLQNVTNEILKIDEGIDFFNLNVIRPLGKEVAPDILKIVHKTFGKKNPNIWLSNYIITPLGARKIIKLVAERVTNLNVNFDRTFVQIIHEESDNLNCFILKPQDKLSIHDEEESSKKDMNNKHILYRIVSLIRKITRGK